MRTYEDFIFSRFISSAIKTSVKTEIVKAVVGTHIGLDGKLNTIWENGTRGFCGHTSTSTKRWEHSQRDTTLILVFDWEYRATKCIWIILLGGKAVSSQTGQIRGVMCQRTLYPTQNPNLSSCLPHVVPQSIWCSLSSYSSPTLNAIFSPKSLIFASWVVQENCTVKLNQNCICLRTLFGPQIWKILSTGALLMF